MRKVYLVELNKLGEQIKDHESQVILLFPSSSVSAFRRFWRVVDEIRRSWDVYWTAVGSRLDDAYADLTNALRTDLGIEAVENRLIRVLDED